MNVKIHDYIRNCSEFTKEKITKNGGTRGINKVGRIYPL